MTSIGSALDCIDKFIGIAKELAKLQALILPQYHEAAIGLYRICQALLGANENIARWLYKFQYFDFHKPGAKQEFLDLCMNYKIMKTGPDRRALKFSCGDILPVYQKSISSKVGIWFTDRDRVREVENIFSALSSADGSMIEFIDGEIIGRIDAFESEVEALVDAGDIDRAEAARLRFKAAMGNTNRKFEQFSANLSELVLEFARIGGIPVTLKVDGP